jgi:hypothetical protein
MSAVAACQKLLDPKEASEVPYSAIRGSPIRQECICALSFPNYIRPGVPSSPLLVALLLPYLVLHHVGQELLGCISGCS